MYTGGNSAGLQPVKSYTGDGHTGVIKQYAVAAGDTNALFRGSPVKLAGGVDAAGIPFVTLAAPGDDLVGVAYGSRYMPTRLPPNYIPYGPAYVVVYVDPHMEFIIGGPADLDFQGECNFNLTEEVGDRCYGFSTVAIDPATKSADETGQIRVLRRVQAPYAIVDGYCDDPAIGYYEVRINCHQYTQKQPCIEAEKSEEGGETKREGEE